MNMRQLKRRKYAAMAPVLGWYPCLYEAGASSLVAAFRQGMAEVAAEIEAAKQEFVCQKVKDGSVVDTFDTREDALALVLKHARQKKAKLQVMDSLTGELVLFAEEEMA